MDIYVGNLPSEITASALREVFESFGRVETADVAMHRRGDESRGSGVVGMPARSEGLCAVLGVHGRNVSGHTITATEVQPMDPVSGACHTRCRCRSGKQTIGDTHPISAAVRSEGKSDDTSKNGLE